MQIIDDVLISDQVWETKFSCDLSRCRGKCCQYGDLGAPISDEEGEVIQKYLPQLNDYLSQNQRNFLNAGVSELYKGTLHIREIAENTPCPLSFCNRDQVILCSLHALSIEKRVPLLQIKPLWCSLFPLMINKSEESWMINLHIPEFCVSEPDPQPVLLSFGDLLAEIFGKAWLEKVKELYRLNGQ